MKYTIRLFDFENIRYGFFQIAQYSDIYICSTNICSSVQLNIISGFYFGVGISSDYI